MDTNEYLNTHEFTAPNKDILLITDSDVLRDTLGIMAVDASASLVSFSTTMMPSPALWKSAPLVIVTDDAATTVGTLSGRFPRRTSVVLVGNDLDDAGIWRRAVTIGSEHVVLLPDGHQWLSERMSAAAGDDPYCTTCQLPKSNIRHRPLDAAVKQHEAAYKAYQRAGKLLAETSLAVIAEMVKRDNPHARYLGFTYSNEYFGHGRSGPSSNAGYLYDEHFVQVPIIYTDEDTGEEKADFDEQWQDEGFLWSIIENAGIDTDDNLTYVLRLADGVILDDATLTEHEADDE